MQPANWLRHSKQDICEASSVHKPVLLLFPFLEVFITPVQCIIHCVATSVYKVTGFATCVWDKETITLTQVCGLRSWEMLCSYSQGCRINVLKARAGIQLGLVLTSSKEASFCICIKSLPFHLFFLCFPRGKDTRTEMSQDWGSSGPASHTIPRRHPSASVQLSGQSFHVPTLIASTFMSLPNQLSCLPFSGNFVLGSPTENTSCSSQPG